jgi:hypothetical protein
MEPNKPTPAPEPTAPNPEPTCEAPPAADTAAPAMQAPAAECDGALPASEAATTEPAAAPAQADDAEREARQQARQEARDKLLAVVLGNQRPKPEAVAGLTVTYLQSIQTAPPSEAAEEWQALRGAITERWNNCNADDAVAHAKLADAANQYTSAYQALFDHLIAFDKTLTDELGRMRDDEGAFTAAPAELRDVLLNYKKGIEIIQRMAKRVQERKKPMATLPELGTVPALPDAMPEALDGFVNKLLEQHHEWRSARGNLLRDAQKASETCKKEALTAVKNLLGALDGIEGGQRSEPEVAERIAAHRAEFGPLIDAWFGAYARIDLTLAPFYAATGLQPHSVEPGTPFHPDTMEPGGTVSDPSRKNEDVASVLRRGYAFLGEFVRPILVEVVVNAKE